MEKGFVNEGIPLNFVCFCLLFFTKFVKDFKIGNEDYRGPTNCFLLSLSYFTKP